MKSKFNQFLMVTSFFSLIIGIQFISPLKLHADNTYEIKQDGKMIVRGKIIDSSGMPLPGANVTIEGTTKGVVSDADGYYVIEAEKGDVLVFSFIGFKEQKIKVGDKSAIDVIMEEETTMLEETVVVGMGTQRKASVVGSISTVKVDELKIPTRSLTNALSGRMAGAVVVQRTGEPGRDEADFWIRGISTFGSNRTPLILVDGVEREMSNIPVEEIESVSILKDASATAVYGVRAANGVVIITTRKGVASKKPSIDFRFESGFADLPDMPEFLDGPNYAMLYNEAFGREHYSQEYIEKTRLGVDPYLYPNVDWFDKTFKKYSTNTYANLNIRGGGEIARYFVSLGYYGENGNLKNFPENEYDSNIKVDRYNFRSNIDLSLTKTTTVDIEVGGFLTDMHGPGIGGTDIYSPSISRTPAQQLFYHAFWATPISNPVRVPIGRDEEGNYIMGWGAPTQVGEKNPAERLYGSGYDTQYFTQIMSQLTLNQDLSFITKGLQFKGSFSFDSYNNTNVQRRKVSSTYGVVGRDEDGEVITVKVDEGQEFLGYSRSLGSNRAVEMKAQLLYDNIFNKTHRVGAMLMYYQRDYRIGHASSAINSLPYRKQGVAFRTTYSYADKYLAEFNLGYNGSENFPKEKRFGYFPAGAVGWLLSNEPFWENLQNTINILKIKGSIGLVGAEALPGGQRFGYLSVYGGGFTNPHNSGWYNDYDFGVDGGNKQRRIAESRFGTPDLTWEKGLKRNVGLELSMFNNAISLELDFFKEDRKDILIQRSSLPAIVGIPAQPFANMGKMVNKGFDGTVEFTNRIGDLGYKVYGNYTFAKNKITEMDEPQKKHDWLMRTGKPLGQQFGLIAERLFTNDDFEDVEKGILKSDIPEHTFGIVRPGDVKYTDIDDDGKITVYDQVPIGYSNIPQVVYGFGLQLDYKNFDIGVFFRGQSKVTYTLGGSPFIPFAQGVGKGNLFKKALDRWTVDNPRQDAFYPRIMDGRSQNNWQPSDRNIYNGSFLRLADMEIGYSIPKKFTENSGVKNLRVYFHGNNLATFSKWDMWDPETGTSSGNNYPLSRKFNFGIRATF